MLVVEFFDHQNTLSFPIGHPTVAIIMNMPFLPPKHCNLRNSFGVRK
jgi:hypothetical protein